MDKYKIDIAEHQQLYYEHSVWGVTQAFQPKSLLDAYHFQGSRL